MSLLHMVTDGHLGGYIEGGDPGTWNPRMWAWGVDRWGIASVLDVGCGEGWSTKYFRDLGLRALGVDGCQQAIDRTVATGHVALHDFCSAPFTTDAGWDLIWSCEFLEHVDRQYVPNILATFSQAKKAVVVTHALPGQAGHHHVNCQPATYWIEWIEALGFRCAIGESIRARQLALDDYLGTKFFAESGLVFLRDPQRSPPSPATWQRIAGAAGELAPGWGRASYRRAWRIAHSIDWGFRRSALSRAHNTWRRSQKQLLRQGGPLVAKVAAGATPTMRRAA